MNVYFNLFRRFIIRALAREKLRSGFTMLGISLGIGVMIAIRLANMSALDSFKTATQSIAGETTIQISGAAGRFDETKLNELGWLRQYGQISPVIEGYALAKTGSQQSTVSSQQDESDATNKDAISKQVAAAQSSALSPQSSDSREFVHILGVDILRDRTLRRYQLLQLGNQEREVTTRDFLFLLTDPQSIVITEKFARKHHLAIEDKLPLTIGDRQREFVIRGLLRDEGPAKTLDGNFVLMDLAAAQLAFNRLGLLDRVDVKLKKELALEPAEAEIS